MKYCVKCGNALKENAIFCEKCGTKIEDISESNNVENIAYDQLILKDTKTKKKRKKLIILSLIVAAFLTTVIISGVIFIPKILNSGKIIEPSDNAYGYSLAFSKDDLIKKINEIDDERKVENGFKTLSLKSTKDEYDTDSQKDVTVYTYSDETLQTTEITDSFLLTIKEETDSKRICYLQIALSTKGNNEEVTYALANKFGIITYDILKVLNPEYSWNEIEDLYNKVLQNEFYTQNNIAYGYINTSLSVLQMANFSVTPTSK